MRFTRRPDRGASAVEFALVFPLLLLLVFGIIQYSWYFYAMQTGTAATGEAVRRLAVGDCQDEAARESFLSDRLGAAAAGTITNKLSFTQVGSNATSPTPLVGGGLILTVTFQTLDFNFPFIPVPADGQVTREFFGRVEDTTSSGYCS